MRWDVISAALTLTSMLAIGQKRWEEWGLAFMNSVVVCILAVHVAPKQWALIPTNLICLVIYTRNLIKWQREERRRKMSLPTYRKSCPRILLRLWPRINHHIPAASGIKLTAQ